MSQLETALTYLEQCRDEMQRLWETVVRLETPSSDPAAVDKLASHLDTYCGALGMETELYRPEGAGACLFAKTQERELSPILLLGHMDTVHPAGSFPGGAWTVRDDAVYGPGVHDCKGGLVMALYVIRALLYAGYDRRQLRLVLESDEETAHTLSSRKGVEFLQRHADGCGAAFTFESGLPDGGVVTRRKGGGILKLTVQGIASHAGTAPEKGASAVLEAARKIVAIHGLSDPAHVTYNCGIIHGGTSANVVPDHCEVSVAIRFHTNAECASALEKLSTLCALAETPGTRCTLGPLVGFPAMEELPRTAALFDIYRHASESLGLGVPGTVFSAGCSDSAYTTAMGIPTLCAVGVLGEGQHSPEEHASLASLLTQAKRLTAAILALPGDF
ncbi:M20 family metallopeptidase [Dysosmobacter sp.]